MDRSDTHSNKCTENPPGDSATTTVPGPHAARSFDHTRKLLRCIAMVVGLGAFLAALPTTSFGEAYLLSLGLDWKSTLLSKVFYLIAAALGGLVLYFLHRQGLCLPKIAGSRICTIGAAAVLVSAYLSVRQHPNIELIHLLVFLFGIVGVGLMLIWFGEYLADCKDYGIAHCVAVLVISYLTMIVASIPLGEIIKTWGREGALASELTLILFSSISFEAAERLRPSQAKTSIQSKTKASKYSLTRYATTMLISFGTTYGIARTVLFAPLGESRTSLAFIIAGIGCCLGLAFFYRRKKRSESWTPQFGLALRICASVTGALLATLPLLLEYAPTLRTPLCTGCCIIQGITMIMFSIEMSHEADAHILSITPVNYAVYAVSEAAALACCLLLFSHLDMARAVQVASLITTLVTFGIIPMLPSRSSTAATFAMSVLPENETPENRLARNRIELIKKYDLSPRESEVLALTLQGLKRQDIADKLSLSSWTVRDHMRNIYAKTGTNSAKELIVLANKQL